MDTGHRELVGGVSFQLVGNGRLMRHLVVAAEQMNSYLPISQGLVCEGVGERWDIRGDLRYEGIYWAFQIFELVVRE